MVKPNPFRGFVDLVTEMERARRLGMTGSETPRPTGARAQSEVWVPAADIYSAGDDLVIRLDVPGVHGNDVEVTLADGVLTISGDRAARPPAESTIYVLERQHGTFRRHMILPLSVEQEHVEAVLEDGVVEITVAGAAAAVAAPDRIPVDDRSRPQLLRGRELASRRKGEA